MKRTGSYQRYGTAGAIPLSAKSAKITVLPVNKEKPYKKSSASPTTGNSSSNPHLSPSAIQEPEQFSVLYSDDLYCDDIDTPQPTDNTCDDMTITFHELQLLPFTDYELEFICSQIQSDAELYREIQCTRIILINLEMFKYNGLRVNPTDKKKLVLKFTQIFRTLLRMKAMITS
jgi:hypothetical protein